MGQNHLPSKSKGQLLRWVRLADPMAISDAPEVLAPAVSSAVSCNAMGQARVEISDSNPCQKWVLNRSQYRGLVFN
ncbi:hypothetical protein RHGRI_011052 [Rhododendron griersonianum]|uniref:Uncharacterized protein n=1 Tax=Rhododendron griersonianum TaxID=479676 RepID=A0AAV6KLM8_9ERIC|nr:hypothetical protein RHGRI_011052 [Rhododendron griersonianum]